jgi:serine/threonine protein kinase
MAQTASGSVVGTAAYMSPEQARAEEDVDHRSDQFSLALVLYEMLSGQQAFARPTAIQTMSAIVEDEPPAIDRPIPAQLRWILEPSRQRTRGPLRIHARPSAGTGLSARPFLRRCGDGYWNAAGVHVKAPQRGPWWRPARLAER